MLYLGTLVSALQLLGLSLRCLVAAAVVVVSLVVAVLEQYT